MTGVAGTPLVFQGGATGIRLACGGAKGYHGVASGPAVCGKSHRSTACAERLGPFAVAVQEVRG